MKRMPHGLVATLALAPLLGLTWCQPARSAHGDTLAQDYDYTVPVRFLSVNMYRPQRSVGVGAQLRALHIHEIGYPLPTPVSTAQCPSTRPFSG